MRGSAPVITSSLTPTCSPPPSTDPYFRGHVCKHSCVVDFKAFFEHPPDISEAAPLHSPPAVRIHKDTLPNKSWPLKLYQLQKGNMIFLKLRCDKSHCDLASTNKDGCCHWERPGQFTHCALLRANCNLCTHGGIKGVDVWWHFYSEETKVSWKPTHKRLLMNRHLYVKCKEN